MSDEPLRLNIGGSTPNAGWKNFNIEAGEGVDYVGDCVDMGRFADNSVADIYSSHTVEHLGYQQEIHQALKEFRRILEPDGWLRLSVPDLDTLCHLYTNPRVTKDGKIYLMRVMFGGQIDPYDFHKVGLFWELLGGFLMRAGFRHIQRVEEHGLFDDTSALRVDGKLISLNVTARK